MRDELERAPTDSDLNRILKRVGPTALAGFLREGSGFFIRMGREDVEAEPVDAGTYRLAGTDIFVERSLRFSERLGVAEQRLAVTNKGKDSSPPIQRLDAFYIPLTVKVKDAPRAFSTGGGATDGFYPPKAYREDDVRFGLARSWEPDNPSFTRWWVARRFYRIASGEGGWSSSVYLPLLQFGWGRGDGELGLWAALEWSGRWELEVAAGRDWQFSFHGGPLVRDLVLEPGETIQLPPAHIGTYSGSREEGFNAVRHYVAESLSPDVEGKRPWPYIGYFHWFGIEHRLDEALMLKQADRSAELGVEYFEVDAAWYGDASENFADGVGNWERVDEIKFPRGLKPLAEYVRSKGMQFGLWFEPERGRLASDWVKQHPDWYWKGKSPVNFHLDLTKREVQDYLIQTLSRWTEELDIRWLRWDYNHEPGSYWEGVDPSGKVQFKYYEGLYRVMDTLLDRHPNLMIDNCASGGNRVDFGTLRRAGTMVISDHGEDPHVCRLMQTGGSRFLPGNYMNSSIYTGENDGDDFVGSLELMSRMAGAISLSGHVANWSAQQMEKVRRHLEAYRTYRHLLMKDFYRLTPYPRTPDDWDVVQFIDRQTTEAIILAYRFEGTDDSCLVKPQRLNLDTTYEIVDPFGGVAGKKIIKEGLSLILEPNSALARHLKPVRP
jgi:alpha-galactosidase